MQDIFNKYYHNIKDLYNSDRESTEHTFRTAFENFLNSYCTSKIDRSLNIRHEPKQQGDMGRPDFKTSNDQQLTIGLIETKKIKTGLSFPVGKDIQVQGIIIWGIHKELSVKAITYLFGI